MTKEQEETIERLNRFKDIAILYGKTFSMTPGQLKTLQEDLKTALNMLKEKDKEIETLKRDFKIVDQECSRLERKEAKQDKIIDLMAERIEWLCKSNGILLDREHNENFTQEDIKQYFESKVGE